PPSDPIIMDEHGQHLHDVVGPYDEGSTITFICEVDGEGGAGILAVGSPPLRAWIHVTATARNDVSVNGLSSFACHDNGWTENNGSSKSSLLLLSIRIQILISEEGGAGDPLSFCHLSEGVDQCDSNRKK
ncbi:hypothetical protein CEXT_402491, partial [Caerostris extrusa]